MTEPDPAPQHPREVREPLGHVAQRLGAVDERIDGNRPATSGVALRVTMLAGHVHRTDERIEAVERKIGA